MTLRIWAFLERTDRRGLGAGESSGCPRAGPEGRGKPSGDVAVLLLAVLGRWVLQTSEKNPSSLPPGSAITWRRTPKGGQLLPGIQPNLDSASLDAKIPKPCRLSTHFPRLPPLDPDHPFEILAWRMPSPALHKERARGLRGALT